MESFIPEQVSETEKWEPPAIWWQRGESERLEPIRFAAVNRLTLLLGYKNSKREVEPYSLRTTRQGNTLFVALKKPSNETRTYRVDRIQSIEVLPKPFKPQHPIEFTPNGRFSAPFITRRRQPKIGSRRVGSRSRSGITYIIQCPYCNKTFRRITRNFKIRKHNQPNSNFECPSIGGRGYLIDTIYGY